MLMLMQKRLSDKVLKLLPFLSLFFLIGCNSTAPETLPVKLQNVLNVDLVVADDFSDSTLNVTIVAFDSKLERASQFQKLLREAEAGYLPVVLKRSLDESRQWAAVKVLPIPDRSAEVLVSATIQKLTPVEISLSVQVKDSRGLTWIDKVYTDNALDHEYLDLNGQDPFVDLFEQIANDMLDVRKKLTSGEHENIVDISMLQYAIALSPESFKSYLNVDQAGQIELAGLPAHADKMYQRVSKIRESEYFFVDAMDEQFESLFTKMQKSYPFWREYSLSLIHI